MAVDSAIPCLLCPPVALVATQAVGSLGSEAVSGTGLREETPSPFALTLRPVPRQTHTVGFRERIGETRAWWPDLARNSQKNLLIL